ncbi:Mini-ribonuclease 3 [Clostridium akagii]|uniref:Mini-ribonuclease 3 n=1 Tax=Clostridium akagii TaxID=91623 RepID=UPI00047A2363|nr:ribonuclease III domain-containing protein [Clostridium akagii]
MEFDLLKGSFTKQDARNLNPLVLAFVGDGIYEIFVRAFIVSKNREMNVHKLHIKAISYVKAHDQSEFMMAIMDELTEEETNIYKRGRNAKSGTVPKNAKVSEYRTATGFEALFGYLYLTEQKDRINYFLEMIVKIKTGA